MSRVDGLRTSLPGSWRSRIYRCSTWLRHPDPATTWLTWIADERIAIGTMPTPATIARLAAEGVTHVVNCRASAETLLSQDLAVERAFFGPANVVHAPMWDTRRRQHPRRWSAAARFVARALDEDAAARVLIHCFAGSHRSVLVAYAALRLRDHSPNDAADLILRHRAEAELLPAYRASVDDWIREGAPRSIVTPKQGGSSQRQKRGTQSIGAGRELHEVLLLGGSRSPAHLKATVDALEKLLPHATRAEFAGLDHAASWNTDRGGEPKPVAQELRRFFG